ARPASSPATATFPRPPISPPDSAAGARRSSRLASRTAAPGRTCLVSPPRDVTRAAAPITAAPAGPLAGTGPPRHPLKHRQGVARCPATSPEVTHLNFQACALECRNRTQVRRRSAVMDARDYIQQHAHGFFADLKQWLAIPSISADPGHHHDVRASAEWLAAHLRATGFPEVEIWETGGAGSASLPPGFARRPAAGPAAPEGCGYRPPDGQPLRPL